MTVYLDLVALLNFLVDFLLLIGTNRLSGHPMSPGRAAVAASLGGIYGGACMLSGFTFLGNTFWRLVCLALMSLIAFGKGRGALRRGVLFVFLSMALGGIATGMNGGSFGTLVASAAGVSLLCLIGFRGKAGQTEYVCVELVLGQKEKKLTALRDTGNTLKDPITGQSVLVVGAEVALEFLGLTREELQRPVETMEKRKISGMRLIPYRAVGQPAGLMLALKMDELKINGKICSNLVAFAPQDLGKGEEHQALAGGVV